MSKNLRNEHEYKLGFDVDKRESSGIDGLDEILYGGFYRGSIILVAGHPGAGKTTFAANFIYSGATKFNEPGVYVSLES